MPTYRRRTRIAAPIDEVWAFHDSVEGLDAVTPSFLQLRVDAVLDPRGEPVANPGDVPLLEGTRIHLSVRPLGLGPRQRWSSRIVERSADGASRWFRDAMESGPFPTWEHTHLFFADGHETVLEDRVRYELPLGAVGSALEPLGVVGFEPMFRHRHRETRRRLE